MEVYTKSTYVSRTSVVVRLQTSASVGGFSGGGGNGSTFGHASTVASDDMNSNLTKTTTVNSQMFWFGDSVIFRQHRVGRCLVREAGVQSTVADLVRMYQHRPTAKNCVLSIRPTINISLRAQHTKRSIYNEWFRVSVPIVSPERWRFRASSCRSAAHPSR